MSNTLEMLRGYFKKRMPHFDLSDTHEFLDSVFPGGRWYTAEETKPPFNDYVASVDDKEFTVFNLTEGKMEFVVLSYVDNVWVCHLPFFGFKQAASRPGDTGESVQLMFPQLYKEYSLIDIRTALPFVDKIDTEQDKWVNPTVKKWVTRLMNLAYHLNTSEAKILDAHPTDWWKPKKKGPTSKYHTRYLQLDRTKYVNCSEGRERKPPEPHDVRGHYRVLATGRKTWVRPHRKGKGGIIGESYKVKRKAEAA